MILLASVVLGKIVFFFCGFFFLQLFDPFGFLFIFSFSDYWWQRQRGRSGTDVTIPVPDHRTPFPSPMEIFFCPPSPPKAGTCQQLEDIKRIGKPIYMHWKFSWVSAFPVELKIFLVLWIPFTGLSTGPGERERGGVGGCGVCGGGLLLLMWGWQWDNGSAEFKGCSGSE